MTSLSQADAKEHIVHISDKKEADGWKEDLVKHCKILYNQSSKPMSETCMCWGFQCQDGWKEPIKTLSYKLEALNLQHYPKYKLRIQADEVKEKFGSLCFYYTIVEDPIFTFARLIEKPLEWLENTLQQVDYGIVDTSKKSYVDRVQELDYDEVFGPSANSDVASDLILEPDCFVKDGKICVPQRRYKYDNTTFPTKHKLLYKMNNVCSSALFWLYSLDKKTESAQEREVMYESLDMAAAELVEQAEKECYDRCEVCGCHIGTEDEKRCETYGWISYVCESCAIKSGRQYYKNGEVYEDGKCVMTAQDLRKEEQLNQLRVMRNQKKHEEEKAEDLKKLKASIDAAMKESKENPGKEIKII